MNHQLIAVLSEQEVAAIGDEGLIGEVQMMQECMEASYEVCVVECTSLAFCVMLAHSWTVATAAVPSCLLPVVHYISNQTTARHCCTRRD